MFVCPFLCVKSCTGAQPENLQGKRGFVESGHFGKSFIKKNTHTQENKAPQGKMWEFFLLDTLKTIP